MRDCTGEEILIELLHHLHLEDQIDEIMEDVINVIPCMMPYIISHVPTSCNEQIVHKLFQRAQQTLQ